MKKITKQTRMKSFTQKDVNDLEKFADRILAKYGIDVEFTRHFVDRLNDPRNSPEIKVSELQSSLKRYKEIKVEILEIIQMLKQFSRICQRI